MQRWQLSDGAFMWLERDFLSDVEAADHARALQSEVPWQQQELQMFGRVVREPRLVAWIGDHDAEYSYSGRKNTPTPWTATTRLLRDAVARRLAASFNAVLANLYRDGQDSMGFHADAEPELGVEPLIASLSFGAPRKFAVRARAGGARCDLTLEHGSLLVMGGTMQHEFVHGLPKQRSQEGVRINLTFRRVFTKRP